MFKANQNIKPPPANTVGIIGWIRKNLLGGWVNTLLTLISIYILWLVLPPLFDWALLNADFSGSSGKECTTNGACWAWLDQRINQLLDPPTQVENGHIILPDGPGLGSKIDEKILASMQVE